MFGNFGLASAICAAELYLSEPGAGALQTLRGERFTAPSNTEKIITSSYGWDWAEPDAKKLGGGSNKHKWIADVCTWPRRPAAETEESSAQLRAAGIATTKSPSIV